MSTATSLSVPLTETDNDFIDYLAQNPYLINITTPAPSRGRIVQEALRALQKQIEREKQDVINEALYAEMAEEFNIEASRRRPFLRRRISALHAEA